MSQIGAVLDAFESALKGAEPKIASLSVERDRDIPVESFPTVVMRTGEQEPEIDEVTVKSIELDVSTELYVAGDTSADLGPALCQLYGAVSDVMTADHTLGGLAVDLRESAMTDPLVDRGEGRQPTMSASVEWTVALRVDHDDPAQAA